jgi:cobalt-zinc-cadmium efflux system outer membrane protein
VAFRQFPSLERALALTIAVSAMLPAAAAGQGSATREPAPGDTVVLTVADVRRLTLTRNPAFLAEREDAAIARGGLRQARILRFNPDLSAAAPGAGTSSPRNPLEATLMQELELAGQRGLRISAARVGVTRAEAAVQNAARKSVAEAALAFYRALSSDRRLAVTRDGLELTTRLLQAVRTQVREGEISTLEGTLAEIEFGRARARVLETERLATASVLELKRVTGLAPDVPVRLVDPSAPVLLPVAAMNADSLGVPAPTPDAESSAHVALVASGTLPDPARLDIDSLVELALTRRPDLAATTATVREFETLASLARREALPNLRLGAVAERVPGESGFRIGPAFGISVPIWNRNQGVVDERLAQVRQAQLQRQAVELRVRTDVETAVRSYRAATQEAATFETTVRQPARTNSALLETAFRAGKIALPTLLLLRNQLLDAELGYWDAWLARQDALVQLQAATGLLASDALSAADTSLPTSSTKP